MINVKQKMKFLKKIEKKKQQKKKTRKLKIQHQNLPFSCPMLL